MKMTILCGISGSGKSTYAKTLPVGTMICSADHYFEGDGYKFNPDLLPKAHGACLKKAIGCIALDFPVCVDNTNTTVAEIAPYAALALAYGYELDIIKISCDINEAIERNVHGVPPEVIKAQAKRLDSLKLPAWWPMRWWIADSIGEEK